MDQIEELLTRGVSNIIPGKKELETVLRSGKKINIFLGIDPTATRIHLGHAVPLRKLQAFAELGHHVTFLIGDFTAMIGDTSDKDTERPILTREEIEINFQTYKLQAEKIVDFSKVKVVYNSTWLKKLNFEDILNLTEHFSVGDFVGRELIRRRLDANKRVSLRETLYPVMQGYDSYHMDTDIQIGGTDQTFNMQAGRTLQKDLRKKESFVLATGFLIGTDGRKMSKSWGNAIWLEDKPNDMYAKVMAITDDVILDYFILGTSTPMHDIKDIEKDLKSGKHPMEIKKRLAFDIVAELYSTENAHEAQQNFEKTVQQKELPTNIPVITVAHDKLFQLTELLIKAGMVTSKTEAKRLIEQGGVEVDNERIANVNEEVTIEDSVIIKVGKRKFVEVRRE
ncbi:MAG TPA: tyrosine--tRNA ligase [Candidatus Saccharimonadales bacterium]|nr:tyrosine--tRNA ligase [Candidatus Saccharimonadales bacterium]